MNFLAHLLLGGQDQSQIIGSLLADFTRVPTKKLHDRFGSEIAESIFLHRKIDCFTDSHPETSAACHLLFPTYRHYSRVIIDIAFDHYLSVNWNRYADIKLDTFIDNVYYILSSLPSIVPENFSYFANRMVQNDILRCYSDFENLKSILIRVESYAKYGKGISDAWKELKIYYDEIEASFLKFFPSLLQYISREGSSEKHNFFPLHPHFFSGDINDQKM